MIGYHKRAVMTLVCEICKESFTREVEVRRVPKCCSAPCSHKLALLGRYGHIPTASRVVNRDKNKTKTRYSRHCPICGDVYSGEAWPQHIPKYCSNRCRNTQYDKRRRPGRSTVAAKKPGAAESAQERASTSSRVRPEVLDRIMFLLEEGY